MKNNDLRPITAAIGQLLAGPLSDPDAIHMAEAADTDGRMIQGVHCHDAWELFCPVHGSLRFVTTGRQPLIVSAGHLLIVPPGCLHVSVDELPQPRTLTLAVMNLPGAENPYGGLSVGRNRTTLSPAELAAWTTRAGNAPGALMEQVALALDAGCWGRERALGLLRVLLATYAEIITDPQRDRLSLDARRVAEAHFFLQSHYYKPELSVETVAASLGLSASHLAALFRKTTGRTLHQTLIDIRLRRATHLLARTSRSVKEIAALTGWGNQFYFSGAYRRRHGHPPSAVRRAVEPGPVDSSLRKPLPDRHPSAGEAVRG